MNPNVRARSQTAAQNSDPAAVLREALALRQKRNPRYSLRAFAAHLGLPPGRLSEILARKRAVSGRLAESIVVRLDLSPVEAQSFVKAARSAAPGENRSEAASQPTLSSVPLPAYTSLGEDAFSAIAEWEHFALLSLLETKDANADPAWLARRLGIGIGRVQAAFDRLERLGLVAWTEVGPRPTNANLAVGDTVLSPALRRSHRQSLDQAVAAIEEVPLELRDLSSVTMAVDLARLPEARALIRSFRRELAALLETGERTEVYNLNIQLVPVTQIARKLP